MPNTPSRGHGKKERARKRNASSTIAGGATSASPYLQELEEAWGETPFVNANPGDYARELAHREEVAMRFLDDHFAGRGGSEVPLRNRPDSVFADPDVAASLQSPSAETRARAERAMEDLEDARRSAPAVSGDMRRTDESIEDWLARTGRPGARVTPSGELRSLPQADPEVLDEVKLRVQRRERERASEAAQEQPRRQRGGIRGAIDRLKPPTAQDVAGRVSDHIKEHGLPVITPEQADAIHKEEEEERWKRKERERKAGLR